MKMDHSDENHDAKVINLMIWSLLVKLINFALISLAILSHFDTSTGGWVGKSKNKDQLSPAKAETRTELGN